VGLEKGAVAGEVVAGASLFLSEAASAEALELQVNGQLTFREPMERCHQSVRASSHQEVVHSQA